MDQSLGMFNSVRGHRHWKWALGVSVCGAGHYFGSSSPKAEWGRGSRVSQREKSCNSPLGVLSQASLKDS